MSNTADVEQRPGPLTNERAVVAPRACVLDNAPQRIALDWLHRDAAECFVDAPPPELQSLVTDAANALGAGSSRERTEARIRLAARSVAVLRTQSQSLEIALAEALRGRDEKGVALLSRVLDGVTRRLAMWLAEHRASCASGGQRSVSVAAGVATVNIVEEK